MFVTPNRIQSSGQCIIENIYNMSPSPRRTFLQLPPHATRSLVLLVLLADTPIPTVKEKHGDYGTIFTTMFRKAIHLAEVEAGETGQHGVDREELTIESYDVVQEEYPSEERVRLADGILITGSSFSAYESLPWITHLTSFVASLPALKPSLKIFGICFGHQIVGRAFGGQVARNEKGWEIGVRHIELSAVGKAVLGGGDKLAIHQMHRDEVPSVPEGFELLGSTPVSLNQGMAKFSSPITSPVSLPSISIITLQGHPEFSPDIVQKIIDAREVGTVISSDLANESREYAKEDDDGVKIARVFLGILGV